VPTPIKTRVGGRIRAAREARPGLTQRELAIRMGVDSGSVSRWERGRNMPDTQRMLELAGILGVELGWFYGQSETGWDR
jgi:transcriptional regulator with XRE-family HTH domain